MLLYTQISCVVHLHEIFYNFKQIKERLKKFITDQSAYYMKGLQKWLRYHTKKIWEFCHYFVQIQ